MSNAVDILLIDGPLSGTMVCQPRPVPMVIYVYNNQDNESWYYETAMFQEVKGNQRIPYRIAVRSAGKMPDYETVMGVIRAANFQKAWDIPITIIDL